MPKVCRSCCSTPQVVTITVKGCNNISMSGFAVVVKDASGATVTSGTTNASGQIRPTINSGTGYTANAGGGTTRFAAASTTFNVANVAVSVGVTMPAATGYACFFTCAQPIKKTLILASNGVCGGITFPNDTLTYGPVQAPWSSSFTGNIYVGAATFSDATNTDDCYVLAGSGLWLGHRTTGSATLLANSNSLSLSCGPPFSWPLNCGSTNIGGSIHE